MKNESFINSYKEKFQSRTKEKRKFLIAGILNVLITNLSLQLFLISNSISISLATFFSQLINMTFGYIIYSKFIFQINTIKNAQFILKYATLMTSLWILNTFGIKLGILFDFSENLSAFILIPVLAMISYLIQKLWVFKKHRNYIRFFRNQT